MELHRRNTVGYLLDPSVLDDARRLGGYTSDEKLAAAIGMTGTAVRNLRHGRSSPSVATLVKLRSISGRPLDGMLIQQPKTA
ncbi:MULTISPECIES: helix-turn-helix domain-containing protein [Corynebacterium]|uniref:helix-turn-helix domain-containing protein n=1 Tax=Corynebacterium TaxID=1716 RepID=UPI00114CB6CF|nr:MULTISPECIES: helix-turn-helix transcriptional regulator [Corynebacterium]MCT1719326.1 helix-turn-helix domain-containing protein [Corynebacterium amycolatum]